MKQRLFEHVGGNQFKLTENVAEVVSPKASLIREGLRKVFMNGGNKLSYTYVANIGMGYIKDVSEARKCAIQEARQIASEYGYVDREDIAVFIKE
jgi:hypothetical protein